MFGREFFPGHRDWQRRYDRDYMNWASAAHPGRDWIRNPPTQEEKDVVFNNLLPAFRQFQRDQQEHEQMIEEEKKEIWKNIPELNHRDLPDVNFGGPKLRPFKLAYDTLQEVGMRFKQSVITIKGNPFYVTDARKVKDRFHLLCEDSRDRKHQTCIDDIDSFRSCPPGYVTIEGQHGHMQRHPGRVNQQGMTAQNVSILRVSTGQGFPFGIKGIVAAIESKKKKLPWNETYRELMLNRVVAEMRLSNEVAVFTKKGQDPLYVGYRGRVFGKLGEGAAVSALDEDDLIQPWIEKHFHSVNLEITK